MNKPALYFVYDTYQPIVTLRTDFWHRNVYYATLTAA